MTCPLGHTNKEWCLDCKYAKEGKCDYPNEWKIKVPAREEAK